jgi:hypothetical protein
VTTIFNSFFFLKFLIGKLLGLAIYNNITLEIPFPLALFKKILGVPVVLDDLIEFDPILGKSLKTLLELTEDIQETFGWTFEIEYDSQIGLGRQKHALKPDGASIPLTEENRHEFVELYIDFLFNSSIVDQFNSFMGGFNTIIERSALLLFRPMEFQELAIGSSLLDFDALGELIIPLKILDVLITYMIFHEFVEKSAQYDGWDQTHDVIKYFWEVVHALSEEDKKKLLHFITGSDRVPVGGLSKLQFVIARNGPDRYIFNLSALYFYLTELNSSDRLPTSHTCYNILLLNEYASKEKLAEKLKTAIAFARCGFFLI